MKEKQWEKLCKKCGKCCHYKHNFGIIVLYDPDCVCKYLNDDNSCEVYHTRQKVTRCMLLKDAIVLTDLLPLSCGYIHINPEHRILTEPKDMPSFWFLVKRIETYLRKNYKEFEKIDLVSEVEKNRTQDPAFKLRKKPAV